jgi:hypothetical protein
MRRRWRKLIWIGPLGLLGIALFIFVGGEIVLHLWNWLLPPLFGWRAITFWQAVGLLALCRILFGNWGGGHRGPRMRMSTEERERFRQGMRARCGNFGESAGGTKEPA